MPGGNSDEAPRIIFGLRPQKKLGQNFLKDPNIIRKIIQACDLKSDDTVLEIGPGHGALTAQIAPRVAKVIAVEKDPALCQILQQEAPSNVAIVPADFLQYDFALLPEKVKVIGNLPYYISSPIIGRLLADKKHFSSIFMTVQLEFGVRMKGREGSKEVGAFSHFVQYYAVPTLLFKIKNNCFEPAPKVDSCFMRLDVLSQPVYPARDEQLLFAVIQLVFQQRRKTILNSLSKRFDKTEILRVLHDLKIDPQNRAENLTLKQYVDLTNILGNTVLGQA